MRIAPLLVARPAKAKAAEVTCAPADIPVDGGTPCGLFRSVVAGPIEGRKAALNQLLTDATLVLDQKPSMFVYRVAYEGARWVGLVCAVETAPLLELPPPRTPLSWQAEADELDGLGWQVEPAVVQCDMPDEIVDRYLNDTNERPAYHFVAGQNATHSAWVVHETAGYANALAASTARRVVRGWARVQAANAAGVPVFAIATRDLAGMDTLTPALAPRCGLFVVASSGTRLHLVA